MSCTVRVAQGVLQGKECTTCNGKKYYSFEGIPYARPPVGRLRFRDPQEPDNWNGVRDATKPGQKCAQMDPYGKTALVGSEDCLYLNVYTPYLPHEKPEKLPVVFFVHGGRYLVGHGDYYRPDYFIEQDVILVTINYRLHILGFLCLHTPEVPGNAAFKDTVMALKWVKMNIQMFNGDNNNITAMGESAGSGLITSYVVSKMAQNFVDKVIGQSGICLSDLMMIEEDPIEKARHVASLLGKELTNEKSLYDFLIDVPIEDLLSAAVMAELGRPPHIINAFFLPVIEKVHPGVERYFDEYPLKTLLDKRHKKVPFLLGTSSHEGALFLVKNSEGKIEYLKDFQRFIPRYLSIPYDSPKSKFLAQKLRQLYFNDKDINDNARNEYVNFYSDAYFNLDIVSFAELYSKTSDLFFYYFLYSGNMNTRTMKNLGLKGASHGDIMQYLFYKKSKADKCSDEDKKMVKFLSEMWCNFAKYGKPSSSTVKVEWPPYKTPERLCMKIDKEPTVAPYPDWNRIKFWLDNMGERSKL